MVTMEKTYLACKDCKDAIQKFIIPAHPYTEFLAGPQDSKEFRFRHKDHNMLALEALVSHPASPVSNGNANYLVTAESEGRTYGLNCTRERGQPTRVKYLGPGAVVDTTTVLPIKYDMSGAKDRLQSFGKEVASYLGKINRIIEDTLRSNPEAMHYIEFFGSDTKGKIGEFTVSLTPEDLCKIAEMTPNPKTETALLCHNFTDTGQIIRDFADLLGPQGVTVYVTRSATFVPQK